MTPIEKMCTFASACVEVERSNITISTAVKLLKGYFPELKTIDLKELIENCLVK